jgi:RNA polymerase-binding transcription factor DksA
MAAEPKITNRTNRARKDHLASMLADRRASLAKAVHGKIRDTRADGSRGREVLDSGESSEVGIQDDIEFALIQMKTETLNQIDTALRRLQEDTYGDCDECHGEITEARLLALPFATRCKHCEERRETIDQCERSLAQRRSVLGLFRDLGG